MIISYGTKNLDLGNVTGITQIIKDTVYHSDTFFVYTETETYMLAGIKDEAEIIFQTYDINTNVSKIIPQVVLISFPEQVGEIFHIIGLGDSDELMLNYEQAGTKPDFIFDNGIEPDWTPASNTIKKVIK
jgi:hypothetical protein